MFDNYKIITVTHQHLNVEDIAQFTVQREDLNDDASRLACLSGLLSTKEVIYLNTCNRVAYIFHGNTVINEAFLIDFFHQLNPKLDVADANQLLKYVQVLKGKDAIEHIFKVAASMESLVIGEREIFRQLRQAYNVSEANGFVDDHLRLLERYIVTSAKRVYANTAIGENPVSVVSLAIKKFLNSNPDKDTRILLIGSGETNTLVGKFLSKHQFNNVSIFNRSLDNAKKLSEMLDAKAYHLSELSSYRKGFDAIFICTASTDPIINVENYRSLIQREQDNKTIVDLSVPHNVDSPVIEQFDVNYIDIEELRSLAEQNLNLRKAELNKAERLIDDAIIDFSEAHHNRQIEKMLRFIPEEIEHVKTNTLDNVYKSKLEKLDPSAKALVEDIVNYMAKKCVAVPMKLAKIK